jgi:hypothetical protein
MRIEPQPTEVRRIVLRMFRDFGASPQSLFEIEESTRIDRGRCVARSYHIDDLMAMWLVEVGILQFYDAEGDMLATVNLLRKHLPERLAA